MDLSCPQVGELVRHNPPCRSATAQVWRDALPAQKRVAILGHATDSLGSVPWNDPSWQLWAINAAPVKPQQFPRWDVLFELHRDDAAQQAEQPEHYAGLRKGYGKPVFMREARHEYPDSIAYPLAEIRGLFRPYFTCSVSYQIALAIVWGAEEIGIWGVNMALDTEYGTQRPAAEYWIGLAEGRGIRVTLPPQTDLLKTAVLYGFEADDVLAKWQSRQADMQRQRTAFETAENNAALSKAFMDGALKDMEYWRQYIQGTQDRR